MSAKVKLPSAHRDVRDAANCLIHEGELSRAVMVWYALGCPTLTFAKKPARSDEP
jgi:hypothetical protein